MLKLEISDILKLKTPKSSLNHIFKLKQTNKGLTNIWYKNDCKLEISI